MANKITVEVDLDVLEAIMVKYQNRAMASGGAEETEYYYNGVVDGLNHAWKFVQGIHDDYMDGVEINK